MPRNKKVRSRSALKSQQAVTYQSEFKKADKAGGYEPERLK